MTKLDGDILFIDDSESELMLFRYQSEDYRKEELFDTLHTVNPHDKEIKEILGGEDKAWPKIIVLDGNLGSSKGVSLDSMDVITFLIESNYTGELLICTDDKPRATEMLKFIDENKDAVKFTYADSQFHSSNNSDSKGRFILDYLKSRKQSAQQ